MNNIIEKVVAGAIFDFAGYLTTIENGFPIGSSYDSSPIVGEIEKWAIKRNLDLDDAEVENWNKIISNEIKNVAKLLEAFKPKDLWNIAEEAVKYVKSEYNQSAFADEIKLPTQFGKEAGPVKLFYSNGNDYIWMIRDNDGFRVEFDGISDSRIKNIAEKYFKKNKIYSTWSEFKQPFIKFKEAESFKI